MPRSIYSANQVEIKDPSTGRFYLHNHSQYEIYLFLEGDAKYIVEGKNYDLSPGDIIIIRKHDMHRVLHCSKARYRRIVIMVSSDFFVQKGCIEYEKAFTNEYDDNRISAYTVRESGLYDAITRFKKYTDNFSDFSTPIAIAAMTEILYLLNHVTKFESGNVFNQTIQNAINYINNHFTGEIRLETLCNELFVSKYHLCRLFKQATGLTIGQYIVQKRLIFADELKRGGKSLTEAAMLSGFVNYSSFYRAYVKKYKESPAGRI